MPLARVRLALMFVALTSVALPITRIAAASESLVAFCRAHPDLDFPDRTFREPTHDLGVPKVAAAVKATNWRCMNSNVYVCAGGASGSACAKMDPNRSPSRAIRQACEDNPGQSFVATAVIANSSSSWRCQGRTAAIIMTVPLDARGFMMETWAPLFDASGKVKTGVELSADPR